MKIINKLVVQSDMPNDNNVIWVYGNTAKYYNNGTWTTLVESNENIKEFQASINKLNNTVSDHTNQIKNNQSQIIANKSAQDEKNATLDANITKLNTRDDQITELVKGITATGGASVATAVTYDNTSSQLTSATVQGAVDELHRSKIDKKSILQELGNAEDKVMSQKVVTDNFTKEANKVNTELGKKANKTDMDVALRKKADAEQVNNSLYNLEKKIGDRFVIEGDVTNLPDEEDLTSVNNKLKLKDREVDVANFQSKGYVILRKNLVEVNGVVKNILTQDMINKPNTIYEIRYDFDLNGETINVPENCTLKFEGGSIGNGTINGRGIYIQASLMYVLHNVELTGSVYNTEYPVEWFGANKDAEDNSGCINRMIAMLAKLEEKKFTVVLSFLYKIKSTIFLRNGISIIGKGIFDSTDWNGNNTDNVYSGFLAIFAKTDCSILDYMDETTYPIFNDYSDYKYNFTGSCFKHFAIISDKNSKVNCALRLRWFFAGEIDNIFILNTNIGIAINTSWNFTISNCKIRPYCIGLYLYSVTQCVVSNTYLFKKEQKYIDSNLTNYVVNKELLPDYINTIKDVSVICDSASMTCIDLLAQSFYNFLFANRGVIQVLSLYFELSSSSFAEPQVQTMISAKNNSIVYLNASTLLNHATDNYTFSGRGNSYIQCSKCSQATCDPTDRSSVYKIDTLNGYNNFYYDYYELDENSNPINTKVANKYFVRENDYVFVDPAKTHYSYDIYNHKLHTGFNAKSSTTISEVFKRNHPAYRKATLIQRVNSDYIFDYDYIVKNRSYVFESANNVCFSCAKNWQINQPIKCANCDFDFTETIFAYQPFSFEAHGDLLLKVKTCYYINVEESEKHLVKIASNNVTVKLYTDLNKNISELFVIKEGVTSYKIELYSYNGTYKDSIDTKSFNPTYFYKIGDIFRITLTKKKRIV